MRTWSSFRRSGVNGYEPMVSTWNAPQVFFGDASLRTLLLFAKPSLLNGWLRMKDGLPAGVAAIVSFAMPTSIGLRWTKGLASHWQVPVNFIGDLDPFDLTLFAAHRCQDADLRKPRKIIWPITYKGIDDRWLELCDRNFRPGWTLKKVCIKMRPVEREHFAIVERALGKSDLESLVGPRCLAILRSGAKLELEGASNPVFYRRGFSRSLRDYLVGARS
jgi:hypothetical protein